MLQNRIDPIEHGDLSALVCIDEPGLQSTVIDALSQIRFGIHTANDLNEAALRLRSRSYEVVVIASAFAGGNAAMNGVVHELSTLSGDQRRGIYAVLVGAEVETESEMEAFVYSVDLTVALKDVGDFKRIVGRGIAEYESQYATFKSMLKFVRSEVH